MSAPVDVLAVIDEAIDTLRDDGNRALPGDLEIARAVVAELIEADKEYDAAKDALAAAKREKGTWRHNPLSHTHPAVAALRSASARRTAALARVQGVRS